MDSPNEPGSDIITETSRDPFDLSAAEELRMTEARQRAILDTVLDYAIFTTDSVGEIDTWPPGAEAVYGWSASEALGRPVAMTFVTEDRDSGVSEAEMAQARETGVAPNIRWHARKDGQRIFIDGSVRLLPQVDSIPRGFLRVGQDVTERRNWEQRQQVLLAELQHRTRNLLGVVRAMFARTRRGAGSIEQLTEIYEDRLDALARVQGLLSRLIEGDRITFDELIRTELQAIGAVNAGGQGERVTLDGPDGVRLRSTTVQTLALALHELATNATKYGAFKQPQGRLAVSWRLVGEDDDPHLQISWVETGVDMLAADEITKGSGYGRELIEQALPYQLHAQTTYELGPDGVGCTIDIPLNPALEPPRGS